MREVEMFIRHKVLLFYKIKIDWMGGECNTHGKMQNFV